MIAWANLLGIFLIAVGTVYWAYELLGGRHGPLGLLMRAVTYSLLSGPIYAAVFGLVFETVAGVGIGGILALEFYRVSRHQRIYGSTPLNHLPPFGAARGVVVGLASWYPFGWKFALAFGLLCGTTLSILYLFGYAPTSDYRSHHRPVLTQHRLMSAFWRGSLIGVSGTVAAWLYPVHNDAPMAFGVMLGLTVMAVSIISSTLSPIVEWWIDNLPERRVAAAGVMLVLVGTLLEGAQPVLTILKIR